MTIAQSKTRDKYPLSTKKIIKKTLAYSLVWIILFFIVSIAVLALPMTFNQLILMLLLFGLVFVVFIIIINYLYQRWYFNVYFYDLTEDYIVIRKGPITPREITIPYERIQDVYLDQDILDRIFGIYDVHLSSATFTSGIQAHIDGLERQHALGLRDLLLKTVTNKIRFQKQNAPVSSQFSSQ